MNEESGGRNRCMETATKYNNKSERTERQTRQKFERERPWGQTTNMQTKESAREIERDERGVRREKTDARRQQQNATMRVKGQRDKQGQRDKHASEREREALGTNNKHANKRERARDRER